MSEYDISGPLMKVKRAQKHIDDLKTITAEFSERRPYQIFVQYQPTKTEVGCEVREVLPIEFPLVLGDAIHNLRSALDLLACCLVDRGGGNAKRARFPFGGAENFDKSLKQLTRAGPAVVAAIKNLNPALSSDGLLAGLHELDIADKHMLLLTTPAISSGSFTLVGNGTIEGSGLGVPNEIGRHVAIRVPGFYQAQCHDALAFKIEFGEGLPFKGKDVFDTFDALKAKVVTVIDELWALPKA